MFANYYYIDEARALNKGAVSHFYAIASDPSQAATVSDAIDHAFANLGKPDADGIVPRTLAAAAAITRGSELRHPLDTQRGRAGGFDVRDRPR